MSNPAPLAIQITVDDATVAPGIARVEQGLGKVGKAAYQAELSTKQLNAALRGVPAQFTDIFTSLQGGQAPLTVLLQQGGQLKDMFGGAGNAAKALGGYVAGLVTPLTATAGAFATLGLAAYKGAQESRDQANAIILSGNAAGNSVAKFQALQISISNATGATKGAVSDALVQIAGTSKISSQALSSVAESAIAMQRATGTAIADTVSQFADLGKAPVEASRKLNEQYNYLTTSIYEQVKALQDEGKASEAATLAQQTYADAVIERSAKIKANLGTLETGWNALGDGAKRAWDKMMNIGRDKSLEEKIADQVEYLRKAKTSIFSYDRKKEEAALTQMQIQLEAGKKLAAAEADRAEITRKGNVAVDAVTAANSKALTKQEQLTKALKDYSTEIENIRKANPGSALLNADQIAKTEASIRAQYADKKAASTAYKNDAAQIFAAEIKQAQDAAKTQVEIIQEKVKQQVISEREGIAQTLAAQNDGFVAQAAALKSQLAKTSDSGERKKLNQEIIALGNDAQVAAEKAATGFKKIEDATIKAQQDYMKGIGDETASLIAKADAAEYELSLIGKTAEQLAVLSTQRYNNLIAIQQAEIARLQSVPGSEAEISLIEQKINALERLKGAEIAKPKLTEQAQEWKKFSDDIERSLTDALMRSFESGESFGDAFIKNLKNTFKTAALKLVIQTVTGTSGSLVNSAINWAAGTSGSNDGAGTNYLGLANNASSAYSLYSGATSAYAAYNATAAGMTFADTTSIVGALIADGQIGTAVGVALKSYFGTVATEVAGAEAAAAAAAKVAATKAAEIAATEAAIDSGALGGAASSVSLAGVPYLALPALALALIQGLSGSTQKYQTGSYLNGTFSGDGFDGSTRDDYHREGGWANDDKNYTSVVPLITTASRLYDASETGQYGYFPGGGNLTGQDSYTPLSADYSGDPNLTSGDIDAMQAGQVAMFNQTKANLAAALVQRQALDTALGTLYTNIKDSVATNLGKAFEDTSFAEKLKGFTHDIDVSLMSGDMTAMFTSIGTELTAAMQSFLLPSVATVKAQSVDLANSLKTSLEQATASGDTTGAEALKTKITQLEAVGAETWTATFGRMMQETQAVAGVLDLFGTTLVETFGKNNMDGILKMSDNLVNLFGGIDAMNTSVNAYYGNFYTEAEKTARSWEMMGKSFESLNLTMPTTRDGFKDIVDGLDLNTLAGQATFKALMDLQGGFAQMTPELESATTAAKNMASELRKSLTEAYAQPLNLATAKQQIADSGGADLLALDASDAVRKMLTDVIANASETTLTAIDTLRPALDLWIDSLDAAAQRLIDNAATLNGLRNQYMSPSQSLAKAKTDLLGVNPNLDFDALAALGSAGLKNSMVDYINSISASDDKAVEDIARISGAFDIFVASVAEGEAALTQAADKAASDFAASAEAARNAALANVDTAYSAVVKAIGKQKDVLSTALQAAESVASQAASTVKTLQDAARELRGDNIANDVNLTRARQDVDAMIASAVVGAMPDADLLSRTIQTLSSDDENNYGTYLDFSISQGKSAAQLDTLASLVGKQGDASKSYADTLKSQLTALNDQLLTAETQVNLLKGIDTSVLSVESAIANLASAILAAKNGGAATVADAAKSSQSIPGFTAPAAGSLTESYNLTPVPDSAMRQYYNEAKGIGFSLATYSLKQFGNAWQLPEWATQAGLPQFAVGTNYVPQDMVAQIHEGEAIIPKAYNPAVGSNNNARLEKLVEGLTAEVQRLQSIVNDGNKSAVRTANAVNGNPDQPMLVETV